MKHVNNNSTSQDRAQSNPTTPPETASFTKYSYSSAQKLNSAMSRIQIPEADDPDGVVIATVATRSARNRDRRATTPRDHVVVGHIAPRLPDPTTDDRAELVPNAEDVEDAEQDLFMSCQLMSSYGEEKGISWYKAMFLIVNAALGAGLLNFPRAFHEAGGIVSGNLVHIIFTLFALGSLIIIARCASERNCKTYQELILHMCSPGWNVVASVCISVYCFVTCITFIIIIGDQFDRAFASFIGTNFCHTWYLNRKFTMTVSSLLLIFPCCFKRIDGLRFMSYVGVLAVWYLMAMIVAEFYTHDYIKGPVLYYDLEWSQIFNVVPTICFGYQCHVSSVPIYSCLKEKNSATFTKACVSAIFVCLCVYAISANYGYLTFGSLVNADVLLSYDALEPQVLIADILLAVKSWTTFPILLFCVREAMSDLYVQMRGLSPAEAISREPWRRKVIAVFLWAASIVFAVFTPNINIVVKLLGSLAAIFIFVFPGMCMIQLVLVNSDMNGSRSILKDRLLCLTGAAYIVVGMFAFGLAFTLGIQHILNPDSVVPICK